MDSQQRFKGGLHTDSDNQFQPKDSYTEATNWVYELDGILRQATAPTIICTLPRPIIGQVTLGQQEIVFLSDGEVGEIGVVEGNSYASIILSSKLLFNKNRRVSAVAKVDYRGHRVVYFADGENPMRRLDLDAPTDIQLENGLRLFTTPQAPTIKLLEVQESGSLPSGIVFAGVRLLTESKNTTPFSILTPPIPITDDTFSNGEEYDGAPLGTPTNKSIVFEIDNLATGYAYAQLVIARYSGTSNQLELHGLNLTRLNGKNSARITYYSESQHEEILLLGELLSEYSDLEVADILHQKDGVLLAAGLQTLPETSKPAWQQIANKIRLSYKTEEIFVPENVRVSHYIGPGGGGIDVGKTGASAAGYQLPELSSKKSLQRGEVYSLCFIPIYDGKPADAYHIPAPYKPDILATRAFSSKLFYPANAGFPAEEGDGTTPIRHHQMPTLAEMPLVSQAPGGYYIFPLGLSVTSDLALDLLTEEERKRFSGYIIGVQLRTAENRSILAQGIAQPLMESGGHLTPTPFSGAYPYDTKQGASGVSKDLLAFYSPETTILERDVSTAQRIEAVAQLNGKSYDVADKREGGRKDKYVYSLFNYTSTSVYQGRLLFNNLAGASTRYVTVSGDNQPLTVGEAKPLSTVEQNGYVLLRTREPSEVAYKGAPDMVYDELSNKTDVIRFLQDNNEYLTQDAAKFTGKTTRYLYNLVTSRPNQYGELEQATFFPVRVIALDEVNPTFFPGDVFIGKFAILSTTAERQGSGDVGMQVRTLNYFFCESSVNPTLRHYQAAANGATKATVPYYPKLKTLFAENGTGVLQIPPSLGHAVGYNRQYSFNNDLQPFRITDSSITQVTSFKNRIAYSAQAVEGEQLDAFRIFQANNYHDIPKNKGRITDVFTLENSLHVHTEQSLWKSFFNEATTQTTSEGETYLGNGGLFPRPSTELITLDGGYAGTSHPEASVNTPLGRFFVSAEQQKVFLYNGTLSEVSKIGMYNYFLSTLKKEGTYKAVYDAGNQRYILSGLNNKSLSFSMRSGAWCCYHDIDPDFTYTSNRAVISTNNQLFLTEGGKPLPASFTFITNDEPDASKVFDGLELHGESFPSTITCSTQSQDTNSNTTAQLKEYGQEPKENELLIRLANHQFQLPLPRDINEGRLKGKWLSTTLTYASQVRPASLKLLVVKLRAYFR